jgi:hypothetical protein
LVDVPAFAGKAWVDATELAVLFWQAASNSMSTRVTVVKKVRLICSPKGKTWETKKSVTAQDGQNALNAAAQRKAQIG